MEAAKILVVDDDSIIRMDIREMLEEAGYLVTGEAKNGQDAVELAYRQKPDLVIMDVKMPVMDGIKASKIIHKMHTDSSVLLLTAYSQKELVQDAQEAGVEAYLVKPISDHNLLPAVEIALSQRGKMMRMKQDIEQLKQSLKDRKLIEKAKGRLMDICSMKEEEAYEWLRDQSMSLRQTIAQFAADLLKADRMMIKGAVEPNGRPVDYKRRH